jgi:hypothetical protein
MELDTTAEGLKDCQHTEQSSNSLSTNKLLCPNSNGRFHCARLREVNVPILPHLWIDCKAFL